jgi:histidinol-phosphate aminotransferase
MTGQTMLISRRALLRNIGITAAATATAHSFSSVRPASSTGRDHSAFDSQIIHLDKNENAYGPSDRVFPAMRSGMETANRFPESESGALVDQIAEFHAVAREQIVLGCGSTEILRMCSGAFLGPGRKLVTATPGFEPVAQYAEGTGASVERVPLTKIYTHDLALMAQRLGAGSGLIYICNPHNPTGTLTGRKDIEALLSLLPAGGFVIVDEAYHHYVTPSAAYVSFIDRSINDPRVIVTRTFSKIYGLAGMRIGYGIATAQTAKRISTYRLLDGVNVGAARAAKIALGADDHVRTCAQRNAANRQEFYNQANARMLRWIDSHANFVLLNTGRPATEMAEHFKRNGVLLASGFRSMENYFRVTIGTPGEMKEFWRVWDVVPQHQMAM